MHYFIGRDIDGDGYPEFVCNLETMALTEDPARALQFTERELEYLDMRYMNSIGFYAIEVSHYGIPMLVNMLFRPAVRGYRPRVAPPPRRVRAPRPMGHPVPPPHGPMGHPGPGYPPHGPMSGPGPRGMSGPTGRPAGSPVGHGPMSGPTGRGPGGRGGIGGPGGRGPGGRGPGF